MLLKMIEGDHLIEVLRLNELLDPTQATFTGRLNIGEEMPEPEKFDKIRVCFPSGEPLPRCWLDVHYRDGELVRGE
ncbi:MAG: acetyltransferase [Gammaproteobacteria bacterium]